MPKVAVLEDRGPQRETLLRILEGALSDGWSCIAAPLFEDVNEFPKWITQNDVWVLVADHFLNEKAAEPGSKAVDYKAPQVIKTVRGAIPYFPVFVLTSYPQDPDVLQHVAEAESVANRRDFSKNIDVYVERMKRAANRFAEQHEADLAELGELARKGAVGKLSVKQRNRLHALQAAIGLGLDAASAPERATLLGSIEAKLDDVEKLGKKIQKFLKTKRK